MAAFAAFFRRRWGELAVRMAFSTRDRPVGFDQRERRARPMIDLEHVLTLEFHGTRLKVALQALRVFVFFVVNIGVRMTGHAARLELFKLLWGLPSMASTAPNLVVLRG